MSRRPATTRILAAAATAATVLLAGAAVAGLWVRGRINASLPRLDGKWAIHGLGSPVEVTRDAQGVPTLSGASRADVARATGWIHAQDRFFQMDILRRRGAGELSELFGKPALPLDREARMHGFRRMAGAVIARERPEKQALLRAYAEGVNAGLAALRSKPWEYAILRGTPAPWTPEDSILVAYAMTLDLQDSTGRYVRELAAIRDELGPASLAFFAPLLTPNDAALDGSAGAPAAVPPETEIDLRRREPQPGVSVLHTGPWEDRESPASNSMAVAASLTAGGGALLANDMHLHLGIPNTWYRVRLRWPGHDETGVSLPGAPMLVAGSTGRIAWGFTNANVGDGDIVVVDPSISPDLYHGPNEGALLPFEHRTETVSVRGSKPVVMDFTWTTWGPVVGEGASGKRYAFHWTEDDPAATNMDILDLEDAAGVAGALDIAHRMGIPPQNFVVADASGAIAWTVAGRLPRRFGYSGRLPVTWGFGDRGWDGFLGPAEVPSVVSPAQGILWTANNRVVGGGALERLGDGGYDIPARARQVRDDLRASVGAGRPVAPADLLGIELDDRAAMLEPWHALLLRTLQPGVVAQRPARAAILEAAQKWSGRADTDSVGYRAVRSFRLAVAHRVLDPIFEPCADRDPDFTWTRLNYEEALEAIVRVRPANLLDPAFPSWDELLAAAVDDVCASYSRIGADPRIATWGQRNVAAIAHPFARFLPAWASSWLRMPADELPGDSHMPRVQDVAFGASERFVVAPGHESAGVFNMPGGQCANPCSPYFRAGHEAWVRGEPAPFLPGPAAHTVELTP